MPKTKKQLIFQAFQTMDVSLLEIVLDEEKTYQEAEKQVFIQKVEEAFDRFKAKGDTTLAMYAGVCSGQQGICENCGKKGKRFVGNHSKAFLDLLFEEKNGEIQDICHCYSFETEGDPETGRFISIQIKKDEQADFKPSDALLTLMIKTRNAVEELTQHPHQIIEPPIYQPWLKEHRALCKTLEFTAYYYDSLKPFYDLYKELHTLDKLVTKKNVFLKAVEEHRRLEKHSEIQCIKWLAKYEKLFYDLLGDPLVLLVAYGKSKDNNLDFFLLKGVKINLDLLKPCADFLDIFSPRHNKILEKYDLVCAADYLEKINVKIEQESGLDEDDDLNCLLF